ncbi:MAG: porin family protein [Acidobacteria bacterium]|nr:porin family protein [Acidobacteriota bacterium]
MRTRALFTSAAFVLGLLACAPAARAQETDAPQVEIGVQYSSLSINLPGFRGTENAPGVGARVTYNLTDYFAVEAEGNIFPSGTQAGHYVTGGAAQQAQFGAKVGRRFRRFGVFGKARPGVVHFSSVNEVSGYESFDFGGETFFFPTFRDTGKTYFSMDVGGVLEFYPTSRIFTRFDVGDTMIRYPVRDSPGGAFVTPPPRLPAGLRHNLQVTAGIGFRF